MGLFVANCWYFAKLCSPKLKEGFTNIIGSWIFDAFLEVTLKWSGTLRNFYLYDIDLLEIFPHDYQRIRNHSEHSWMDLDDLSFTYNDNWTLNTVMERFRCPNRFIILVKSSFNKTVFDNSFTLTSKKMENIYNWHTHTQMEFHFIGNGQ